MGNSLISRKTIISSAAHHPIKIPLPLPSQLPPTPSALFPSSRMPKVYPNLLALEAPKPSAATGGATTAAVEVLTVWRKSLLFNCGGFTVFDSVGNLAFRVDNYSSSRGSEIVLLDAAGKPLLSFRRKKLSLALGEHWRAFEGEEAANPRFSVRKHVSFLRSSAVAHVTPCGVAASGGYEVEGSYSRRSCEVYGGERRRLVAEIQRKECAAKGVALGADVFRLVVHPGFDSTVAMAIVVLLDQMF